VADSLPPAVRAAFEVPPDPARRLPGGGGTAWRTGDLILKPGHHPVVGAWLADVFADLDDPGFRVPRPVRAADGGWLVDGWAAWTAVDGEPDPVGHWPDLVAAGRAFHTAIADVPIPRWIGRSRHRWGVAERAVWDGQGVDVAPELADLVAALHDVTRPIALPAQLIHGDLAGNVLFADGQPPAIIDFSPCRRPAGYALAIAAVDVLTWNGAPAPILGALSDEDEIDQLLLRAAMWRLITESLGRTDPDGLLAVRRANEPVVDLLLSRVSGRSAVVARTTDRGIAALTGRLLGDEITGLRPTGGGYSGAVTRIAERDGGPVFVKTGTAGDLDVELTVYESVGSRAFLPRLLASVREPVPMLVAEALDPDGWVREWTPDLVDATRDLLHEVHSVPAPPGVPRLGPAYNPWTAIAADPVRLLRMDVCSERWLTGHLDTLAAAAAEARVEGASLIHRDVCRANLWALDGRLVLVDWASAAIGDPWFDHHLWLVACHAEGGPEPESGQGPRAYATGHAALIAGQQPLLAPARDTDPALFDQRRDRLRTALSWAARLLELPPI
jgi:uncharacterized protein (TIGR02569 family)